MLVLLYEFFRNKSIYNFNVLDDYQSSFISQSRFWQTFAIFHVWIRYVCLAIVC